MKQEDVWNKIFPLKIGDRVIVKRIFSRMRGLERWIGKEGRVIEIRTDDKFEDVPSDCKLPSKATVYVIQIRSGTHTLAFRREELELLEEKR